MFFLISWLMRYAFRLAIVGLLALATAPAHAEYIGGGAISAPYNCSWPTGVEMTRARYIPGETADGFSHVTLNFAVGGLHTYSFRQNLTPSRTWRRGTGRVVWGEMYFMTPAPQVRVARRHDAVFNAVADMQRSTDIRLRLRIRNFNGEAGCAVTVSLMLHRWN